MLSLHRVRKNRSEEIQKIYCGVEQLVARWAHNPKVTGSSPVPATKETPEKSGVFFVNIHAMYYVYVLYSEVNDTVYIGFTSALQERLAAHNHLKNKGWTKRYQPWKLIYSEPFTSKTEAMKREKELKSYQGRNFIRSKVIPNQI